jgi:hypothetical protein
VLRWGGGSAPRSAPRTLCGKGALPVEHLAHWAEFWAKKRPRKIILGQNFGPTFSTCSATAGGTQGYPGAQWGAWGCGAAPGWGGPWGRAWGGVQWGGSA